MGDKLRTAGITSTNKLLAGTKTKTQRQKIAEAAGVDSVPELAQRNAENLTKKMAEVNKARNLTRRDPVLKEVEKWVAKAKTLPRALED